MFDSLNKDTYCLPLGEVGYKSSQVLLLWVSKELWEKQQLLAIHRRCVRSLIKHSCTVNFFCIYLSVVKVW